jgi:hypothetical protein
MHTFLIYFDLPPPFLWLCQVSPEEMMPQSEVAKLIEHGKTLPGDFVPPPAHEWRNWWYGIMSRQRYRHRYIHRAYIFDIRGKMVQVSLVPASSPPLPFPSPSPLTLPSFFCV